jgi:GMP synthase (glutamine-hydrolysing)
MHGPLLLFQLGEAPEAVRRVHGHFASWYERALATSLHGHDGRAGGRGPEPRDFAGVVITGSSASLTRPEPWMDDACDFVLRAADAGVPILGVCFGHQLIGRAFGAAVAANPRGWEIGTHAVELTDAGRRDPLFAGLGPSLRVNLSHEDHVAPGAAELTVLAGNPHTPLQAIAVADHVRGLQFHPEITGAIVAGYIDARRPVLSGLDPDVLLARAADCPDGPAVFANFRRHFVERA